MNLAPSPELLYQLSILINSYDQVLQQRQWANQKIKQSVMFSLLNQGKKNRDTIEDKTNTIIKKTFRNDIRQDEQPLDNSEDDQQVETQVQKWSSSKLSSATSTNRWKDELNHQQPKNVQSQVRFVTGNQSQLSHGNAVQVASLQNSSQIEKPIVKHERSVTANSFDDMARETERNVSGLIVDKSFPPKCLQKNTSTVSRPRNSTIPSLLSGDLNQAQNNPKGANGVNNSQVISNGSSLYSSAKLEQSKLIGNRLATQPVLRRDYEQIEVQPMKDYQKDIILAGVDLTSTTNPVGIEAMMTFSKLKVNPQIPIFTQTQSQFEHSPYETQVHSVKKAGPAEEPQQMTFRNEDKSYPGIGEDQPPTVRQTPLRVPVVPEVLQMSTNHNQRDSGYMKGSNAVDAIGGNLSNAQQRLQLNSLPEDHSLIHSYAPIEGNPVTEAIDNPTSTAFDVPMDQDEDNVDVEQRRRKKIQEMDRKRQQRKSVERPFSGFKNNTSRKDDIDHQPQTPKTTIPAKKAPTNPSSVSNSAKPSHPQPVQRPATSGLPPIPIGSSVSLQSQHGQKRDSQKYVNDNTNNASEISRPQQRQGMKNASPARNGSSIQQDRSRISVKDQTSRDLSPPGRDRSGPRSLMDPKIQPKERKNSFTKQSNKKTMVNAITYACLPGELNRRQREKLIESVEQSQQEFIVFLFKQYTRKQIKGIYALDGTQTRIIRLFGEKTPPQISADNVRDYYRYDTGSREFKKLDGCKSFSLAVHAVDIK